MKLFIFFALLTLLAACKSDSTKNDSKKPNKNYLTSIPISELDTMLQTHYPSFEGSLIATKEFKERLDTFQILINEEYQHAIVDFYTTHIDNDIWIIDSLFAIDTAFYPRNSKYLEGVPEALRPAQIVVWQNIKKRFLEFSQEKKGYIKGLKQNSPEVQLLKKSVGDVGSIGTLYWLRRVSYGYDKEFNFIPSNFIFPSKIMLPGHYYHATQPIKGISYIEFSVSLLGDIVSYEPFIVIYRPFCAPCPSSVFLPLELNTNKYKYGMNPPCKGSAYIVALAKDKKGKMLAAIEKITPPYEKGYGVKAHYEVQMKPMKYKDFEAQVNALP